MTHITQTVIADTSKGKRVWLQGLSRYNWAGGTRYNVTYEGTAIVYTKAEDGKRAVTADKGGIIDTVGKKVTQWSQGASEARVHIGAERIHIEPAQ